MKLTENFTRQEFDCKDGTKVPAKFIENVTKLAQNLEVLRAEINEPIKITGSGYRTKSHNDKVGGAKNSLHLTASAADINAKNYTPKELSKVIERLIKQGKMVEGGIGVYKGFLHYDIRGTKSRW